MSTTALGPPETRPGERRQPPSGGDPGIRVDRTCTEIRSNGSHDNSTEARQLTDFRAVPAYVLLGDPGAGKTTEFEKESEALGDAALMLPARNLRDFSPADHPEWWNKILFIDGLDEMRTGTADAATALGAIRGRLDQLGKPDFRISCREADWLGPNDIEALRDVSRTSQVTLLRLDPLSPSAIREMLGSRKGLRNVSTFLGEALRRGVYSMLGNPLTLDLLAKAVQEGETWPEGRHSTFEIGCRTMIGEHPDGRRDASAMPPTEIGLEAAGYVCSLLLLSDNERVTLNTGSDSPGFVSLHDLGGYSGHPSERNLRAALGTRLFKGADDMRFVPLHRQIAEFLAGRHLAKRISAGLPARRVRALMVSPGDGRVVTALRGLSAWLAAHSPEARRLLIDADPVGVILYGDIREFTTDDKKRLLRALERVAPHERLFAYELPGELDFGRSADTGWACQALGSADMAKPIKELLSRRGAAAPDERVERLIFGALSHVDEPERESHRGLLPDLATRVRDDARPPVLRRSALDAYLHLLSPGNPRAETLVVLLDEIREGTVSDPDGELTGTLLDDLYPAVIPPARVWRYLPGQGTQVFGRFWRFWQQYLLEQSSHDEVAELLDALDETVKAGAFPIAANRIRRLYIELLARGLSSRGEALETERLYTWLSIPVVNDLRFEPYRFSDEPIRRVRSWLESHPEAQKAVFLARLRHRIEDDDPRRYHMGDRHLLHGSRLPADFGLWCLEKAIEIGDAEASLSGELLRYSFYSLDDPSVNEGLTLDVIRGRIQGQRGLALLLEKLCEPPSRNTELAQDHHLREWEKVEAQQREEERQRREEWAQLLRSHEKELRENRFSPPNLHHLAKAYLGLFSDSDAQIPPRHRLVDFVGDDEIAIDAALAGLRGAARREDVPDVAETISLCIESQQPWLAYPVLASLELLDEEDPAFLDSLGDAAKRKALAIYYCSPAVVEVSRRWYDRWLQQDRDLVLGVVQRCAVSAIRAGQDLPDRLRELDADEDHASQPHGVHMVYLGTGVGPRAVGNDDDLVHDLRLQLLRAFPIRGPKARMPLLEGLLVESLQHPDTTSLEDLIDGKLALTSMSAGQRVRWLAVDAVLAPVPGLPRLEGFIGNNEVRARHLASFLSNMAEFEQRTAARARSVWSILSKSREPATLRVLIEMLGPLFAPTDRSGYISSEQAMSEFITSLIGQLGSISDDEAGQALTELIVDPRLAAWHGHLNWSRGRHRVANRDASYTPRSIDEIQGTLDNRAPANAADLAALLAHRLADIAEDVRGGSSDGWRQFWSNDHDDQGRTPKVENSCRDAVLAALQTRLPPEVDAVPEGQYAADRRADIRASCRGFNVPIEIKRNSDRNLWCAPRAQLIPSYTTDPATEGYGIYLVLWFGADDTKRDPNGARPATPKDLEQQLESTLTPDEARKISVIVMDVTKPGDRRESSAASEPRLH